jgi:hypothetical protein
VQLRRPRASSVWSLHAAYLIGVNVPGGGAKPPSDGGGWGGAGCASGAAAEVGGGRLRRFGGALAGFAGGATGSNVAKAGLGSITGAEAEKLGRKPAGGNEA